MILCVELQKTVGIQAIFHYEFPPISVTILTVLNITNVHINNKYRNNE